jgi:hypothetical protein
MLGSWILTDDGEPILYAAANGRRLYSFAAAPMPQAVAWPQYFRELARIPARKSFIVEQIDDFPVQESPFYRALREAGFVRDLRGMVAAP